jgi:hypothetical protein
MKPSKLFQFSVKVYGDEVKKELAHSLLQFAVLQGIKQWKRGNYVPPKELIPKSEKKVFTEYRDLLSEYLPIGLLDCGKSSQVVYPLITENPSPLTFAKTSLAIDPCNFNSRLTLAICLLQIGDLVGADAHAFSALEFSPGRHATSRILRNLAVIGELQGNEEKSQHFANESFRANPADPLARCAVKAYCDDSIPFQHLLVPI